MTDTEFDMYCSEFLSKVRYFQGRPTITLAPGDLLNESDALSNAKAILDSEVEIWNRVPVGHPVPVLDRRISECRRMLAFKSSDYSTTNDKLYNFKRASVLTGIPPERVLTGFWIKHWVSCLDMIQGIRTVSASAIDEKFGDAFNYMVLLGALLNDRNA